MQELLEPAKYNSIKRSWWLGR